MFVFCNWIRKEEFNVNIGQYDLHYSLYTYIADCFYTSLFNCFCFLSVLTNTRIPTEQILIKNNNLP